MDVKATNKLTCNKIKRNRKCLHCSNPNWKKKCKYLIEDLYEEEEHNMNENVVDRTQSKGRGGKKVEIQTKQFKRSKYRKR
mmetsp:Transcript_3465/g.4881  ORF Transcript_3465/g.4881 Transcript_3465/m.4881 type:complete len:81 (+) Transcript_3465:123-365(+)